MGLCVSWSSLGLFLSFVRAARETGGFLCHPSPPSPPCGPTHVGLPSLLAAASATRCLARALPPDGGRGPGVTVSGPLAALVQPMVVYGG